MSPWENFWIADLRFSPSIEAKFRWEKGISPESLHRNFVGNNKLRGIQNYSPEYGERWFVYQRDEPLPRVVLIVKEISKQHSIWQVMTAFRTSNPKFVGR